MTAWKRAGREPRELIQGWRDQLQRVAAGHGDRVEMRVNRFWIAFRSENQGRAFAEIRPVNTTVVVKELIDPRWLLELEVHAVVT